MGRELTIFHEHADQAIVSTPSGSYDMADWDDYRQSLGFDQDSPTPSDPQLVDPMNNDFAPGSGSPAIDQGVSIAGRDSDFLWNPMQGTPDIGAIEAQP